jgi:GNAT superfamily N-acetyltransferase
MTDPTPSDYTIRPATTDDFDAVLNLIAAENLVDYNEPMISAEYLWDNWESPNLNLATDTWVVIAPDGQVVGYGELSGADSKFDVAVYATQAYKSLFPHLLNLAEKRAMANGTPASILGRVSERNRAGSQSFEAAGYQRRLSFILMEIVMTEPPAEPALLDGITIRPFIAGQDEQATYAADEEASTDKGYHHPLSFEGWSKRMGMDGDTFDPTLWFLAYADDEIAGVVLNAYSDATRTGWVDHLGVRRGWRNKGIGMALLRHSFGEFYRRGISRVKLSVDSQSLTTAPRLYEAAGMQTINQYHIYRKDLLSKT